MEPVNGRSPTTRQPKQIIGIEPSPAFVETAQARHGNDAATFKVGDAANLPLDDAQADWLVSGLALNFFPDLPGALTELRRVVVSPLDVPTHFTSFDDYWQPFLGGVGPAPAYYTALSAAQPPVFAQQLRQTLPIAEDGSISLVARAWAVRGTVISSVF